MLSRRSICQRACFTIRESDFGSNHLVPPEVHLKMCCFLGKNVHFQPFLGYFGGISYTNLVLNWLFKINPFLGYFGPIYASGRELCLRQAFFVYFWCSRPLIMPAAGPKYLRARAPRGLSCGAKAVSSWGIHFCLFGASLGESGPK